MNIMNEEVSHKHLGVGHVVSLTEKIITIQFGEKQMKFSFPSVFNELLTMKNPTLQLEIKALCANETIAINKEKEERLTEFGSRFAPVPDTKPDKLKREKQLRDNSNIAIRCNYCDGGRSETVFGYHGVCSEDVLRHNVSILRRPWCNANDCACKRYTKGEITRAELEQQYSDGSFICNESRLLKDWVASAERHQGQSEKKTDKPAKMTNARVNRLCVLTTKQTDELEAERKIFAAFVISKVEVGDDKAEGNVHAHTKYRIDLTPKEAQHVRFWNFHKNPSKPENPFWGSGMLRHITDAQSINILKAMMEAATDPDKKAHILEVLEYYCRVTAAASKQ